MREKDGLFSVAKELRLDFSSLRRAAYSTKVILQKLHEGETLPEEAKTWRTVMDIPYFEESLVPDILEETIRKYSRNEKKKGFKHVARPQAEDFHIGKHPRSRCSSNN